MARADFETSIESGQPVSLYLFRYGSGPTDHYAYTNAERDVAYDSVVYSSLNTPDQLDEIESKQRQSESEIKIRMPLNSEIVEVFKVYPPTQVVTVVIREGHIPNTDDPVEWAAGENFPVSWLGRVLEVERDDESAVLMCDSSAASMRRPGLRHHFQYPCRFTVYRGRCGADETVHQTTTTVAAVTGNRVELDTPWMASGRSAIDYHKGRVEWDGPTGRVVRQIMRVDATNTIVLTGPATDLAVTDSVDLFIGCTKGSVYCRDVHNTIQTYGGFLGIPKLNPTGKNNHT